MAFPPRFLEELRDRVSLAGVIGRRVKLQRRGRSHVGLCPFHNEKTPSFNVIDEKGFYHCFGCGAHGDAIEFVRRTEGLSFVEAVERLAGEAGLPVPQADPAERERFEREAKLRDPLESAARWFEQQLRAPGAATARRYIEGRGLRGETIARFRLGYAPASRTALKEALLKEGHAEAALVEAGLLRQPDDGGATYDYFRDRIMFPIADARGRVIGFGARAMGDAQPKYLNSPETPLFRKGRTLYNLAIAREASRGAGAVIAVEGYMDVIALAEAGIEHAVAPLGTALTEEQMQVLWRLVPEPHLCFDGDNAGVRAALRAAERALPLLKPGHSFRFVMLPEGEDPDSLVRKSGRPAFDAALGQALPLAELLWRATRAAHPADTPERQAAFEAAVKAIPARIEDPTVRDYYERWIYEKLREGKFQARQRPWSAKPRQWQAPSRGHAFTPTGPLRKLPSLADTRSRRERSVMALVLAHPALLAHVDETLGDIEFSRPELDRLRHAVLEAAARFPALDSETLRRHLSDNNLAGIADGLLPAATFRPQVFRPDAELDEVWRQFAETASMLRQETLVTVELRQEETALAEAMNEQTLRRFLAVKRQASEAAGTTLEPGRKD
ncbi:DNA primase [Desertibaculum subflavum]|uniref:DNA primase n=1 Tax=Desertibaculum subflavum TaxID=2268458 RepID=UPI000E675B33